MAEVPSRDGEPGAEPERGFAERGAGDAPPGAAGHRQRLRQRFLAAGADALPDYELLELILQGAMPRIDTKPIAKALLERFDGFVGAITAEPDALASVKGMGEAGVAALKAIEVAAVRLARLKVLNQPVISNWQALLDYCTASLAHDRRERFHVLLLDKKNVLIADEQLAVGTVDHTPVYIREVVKRVLDRHASAVILVHNHPSGDPTPSRDDITMTNELVKALKAISVEVHDHLVIGSRGYTSFKSSGLL
ncbi:MAG: JAB domain-containing protein [Alphaproteobacteria bacterium]|nr:DNA repair protein RadC [Alphaproteobacteria bacterium]TAD91599.1 MAG: JAB domain-containing protein [Alphaproteobacteria bacterium]